jgi:hypothetical protein
MKKELTLSKNQTNYVIKEDEKELICFSIEKKIIQGKDIYEKIYQNVPVGEKIEIEINEDLTLKDKDDDIVFNRIKELFEGIDNSINETNNQSQVGNGVAKVD